MLVSMFEWLCVGGIELGGLNIANDVVQLDGFILR